ncbi:MAG: hypothetical protein OSB09_10905 [Planctomycetota bacterium]|nr:hypothetical protein [Planctomycetota bacterium]
MSNWEPENVSDADMENIAGGAGKDSKKASKKPASDNKPMPGFPDSKGETDKETKGRKLSGK